MSEPTSHQTLRLSSGRHWTPGHGACVMELASMLAGERFSDRPECASPVIAAFLRDYNDRVGDARRQDLYPYAARVVGTRAPEELERRRAMMCLSWARRAVESPRHRRWRRRRLKAELDVRALLAADRFGGMAGRIAAAAVTYEGDEAHAGALAFVDELIEIHRPSYGRLPWVVTAAPDPRAIGIPDTTGAAA